MTAFRQVVVLWNDIVTCDGWRSVARAKKDRPHECRTPGYIVHETDAFILIAGSLSEDAGRTEVNSTTAIPRGCIKEIQPIAESSPVTKEGA